MSRRKFAIERVSSRCIRVRTSMPRVGKSRSPAQRLQSLGALLKSGTNNKENSGACFVSSGSNSELGSSFHNSKLADLQEKEKSRTNFFKRKLHNVARKLTRSVETETQSRAELTGNDQ